MTSHRFATLREAMLFSTAQKPHATVHGPARLDDGWLILIERKSMRFTIYQPLIDDARYHEINKVGWGNTDWDDAYLKVTSWLKEGEAEAAVSAALDAGLYAKSYLVEADDVSQTFAATNGMGPGVIERFGRPKSGSVGDVAVDANGTGWACLSFGWAELSEDLTTRLVGAVAQAA